ncbi:hypothetical protein AB9F26_21720 [Falsihalocynthiibacter sp. BN13B15]|uniref:hypothetical protein n=1 Tax=Falsihalocynthiibacter sp. BN13B15 TaxID=3240871 RepID=UPI003510ADAD
MTFYKPHKSLQKPFTVLGSEERDIGAWRIRLSKPDRLDADRHCLLRVSHLGKSGYFIGLGHQDGDGVAKMDFDVREHLGIGSKESKSVLKIEIITGWRSIYWYLRHRDPHVYVPAYVGLWSLALGFVGIIMGVFSMFGA